MQSDVSDIEPGATGHGARRCGALSCTVTAKGVETEAQLETLAALGCERVQGFLLARPMSVDELATLRRPAG